MLEDGKFGPDFFSSKGVPDCDVALIDYFYLYPDSVFIKEITKMVEMNLPIFETIRQASKTMDSAVNETLGPLSYALFHVS
jgi:hypothetical protein